MLCSDPCLCSPVLSSAPTLYFGNEREGLEIDLCGQKKDATEAKPQAEIEYSQGGGIRGGIGYHIPQLATWGILRNLWKGTDLPTVQFTWML